MKRHLLVILSLCCSTLWAQTSDSVSFSLNARFNPGLGNHAPFLSTVNQYDRHSLTPNSLSTWATLHKTAVKPFDYGFGAEINANLSPTEQRLFPGELYAEGKIGPFLAVLGMKREIFGNQDPVLSSGGLIASQNSRPIPALTFETNGWVDVPFIKGYLEFLGGMANGKFTDHPKTANTLLHHKWLHARVGGNLPFSINYGLHHVAQWIGSNQLPTDLDNFTRIFLAHSGTSDDPASEFVNTLGNHIISQNIGFTLKLTNCTFDAYWQNISEDKPILFFNKAYNKRDGLWGLSVRMPKFSLLHSLAAEFLSTTDQTGPWHDLDGVIMGGSDNYYNNGLYPNGWSFYGMTIGNPWLTSPKYNTNGGVGIQNNCVRLLYLSGLGEWNRFNYRFTTAFSQNWGYAKLRPTTPKKQFSGQLDVFHELPFLKNTEVSLGLSGDRGAQYGNNLALLFGFRHTGQFLLTKKH